MYLSRLAMDSSAIINLLEQLKFFYGVVCCPKGSGSHFFYVLCCFIKLQVFDFVPCFKECYCIPSDLWKVYVIFHLEFMVLKYGSHLPNTRELKELIMQLSLLVWYDNLSMCAFVQRKNGFTIRCHFFFSAFLQILAWLCPLGILYWIQLWVYIYVPQFLVISSEMHLGIPLD